MSVSDNLLLVHSLEAKVVLIFDLKINTQFPISAPLPLATLPLSRWPSVYTPHWVLAAPDVVIDPQMGVVGILKPDLAAVAHSSIDKECLLQFLLARSNAHDVVLDVLARAVRDAEPLPVIARCFDLVCAAAANAVLRRRALLEGRAPSCQSSAIASPWASTCSCRGASAPSRRRRRPRDRSLQSSRVPRRRRGPPTTSEPPTTRRPMLTRRPPCLRRAVPFRAGAVDGR